MDFLEFAVVVGVITVALCVGVYALVDEAPEADGPSIERGHLPGGEVDGREEER